MGEFIPRGIESRDKTQSECVIHPKNNTKLKKIINNSKHNASIYRRRVSVHVGRVRYLYIEIRKNKTHLCFVLETNFMSVKSPGHSF